MSASLLDLLVTEQPSWMRRALCRDADPDVFYPDPGGQVHEAVRICAECPVQMECLDYALESGQRLGIWGGTSRNERKRLGYRNAA